MSVAWLAEGLGEADALECPQYTSAKAFLQSRPAGVYTCARALKKTSTCMHDVVVWPFHLQRLADGLASVDDKVQEGDLDTLKSRTEKLATEVLTKWQSGEDAMLSVLWYRRDQDYHVAAHICAMPKPKCLASTVLVHGDGRDNARCKHTQWISDRVPIEEYVAQLAKERGAPIHEVLLSRPGPGDDRLLLEGLITNFYVVKDGTLFTAGDRVLEGSTRELVLKACKELAIPVVLEAPKLSERASWQAAFVTSAVRVVIDVTRLLCEDNSGGTKVIHETVIPSDTSGFTQRIRDQIRARRY